MNLASLVGEKPAVSRGISGDLSLRGKTAKACKRLGQAKSGTRAFLVIPAQYSVTDEYVQCCIVHCIYPFQTMHSPLQAPYLASVQACDTLQV
jgi:hypothetical protein